jgi:hypothetical protein
MILTQPTKDRLDTLASVEEAVFFLGTLLQDAHPDTLATEEIDEEGLEVKSSVVELNYVPVVLPNGVRTFRAILRLSLPVNKSHRYKAAPWSTVTPIDAAANPNTAIVAVLANT